ncbi:MAG: class I SAM-dependent methyltransferase [Streptosporangiaceae bacterium]|nr:class I SAM-dependent methyltransferase [Streptosporangiaceae bacterium]
MPDLDRATAQAWIDRWDRQQEENLPDREERFTALIDAVEAAVGRDDPLILDLGCGPGSLAIRLLDRIPGANVIGIDADPVTLALGQAAYGATYENLRFIDLDLRVPGWSSRLPEKADAAVSTTALHWLYEPELIALYKELATVLKPGGLLLDGDHFQVNERESPILARLDRAVRQRENTRRFPDGHAESWYGWWEAVTADPLLREFATERQRRRVEAGHHDAESTHLATHVNALKAAGFAEIGTLWQRGDNRLLCAALAEA